MWTTVYVSSEKEFAINIENRLKTEGFLIKIKEISLGDGEETYEILAPKFEAEDVQAMLFELGII